MLVFCWYLWHGFRIAANLRSAWALLLGSTEKHVTSHMDTQDRQDVKKEQWLTNWHDDDDDEDLNIYTSPMIFGLENGGVNVRRKRQFFSVKKVL